MPIPAKKISITAAQTIEIHSDVHLHASDRATFELWKRYIETSGANDLIILGDLFEVWIGDDWGLQDAFALECAAVLKQASQNKAIYFLHGNRDFLLGEAYAHACGMVLLADPCVLEFSDCCPKKDSNLKLQADAPLIEGMLPHPNPPPLGEGMNNKILLTHGDAWTLADTKYQHFRKMVRCPAWQADFLTKPLAERAATAAAMRLQSQMEQMGKQIYADVDVPLALQHLQVHDAQVLVHGHTHKPSHDTLDGAHERWVLSDWDAKRGRGDVLRVQADADGLQIECVKMA